MDNRYKNLFKKNMTSKQIAIEFFRISDNFEGQEKEMLTDAFNKAFIEAQHRETALAFANSGKDHVYCAN